MRQLTTILISIISLSFGYIQPSYSITNTNADGYNFLASGTIAKGGIDYSIPIDYTKLSEPELEVKARTYYFNALNYKDNVENEDMTNALMLYSVLQNKNPEKIEYSTKLGILYDKLGKDRQAKGCLSRAISINPKNPIPYFYLGEFYYKREFYRKALKYYNQAYNQGYNTNYDTLYKIGDIYQKFGDTRSALKYLKEASVQSPNEELNSKIREIEQLNLTNKEYYVNTRIRN